MLCVRIALGGVRSHRADGALERFAQDRRTLGFVEVLRPASRPQRLRDLPRETHGGTHDRDVIRAFARSEVLGHLAHAFRQIDRNDDHHVRHDVRRHQAEAARSVQRVEAERGEVPDAQHDVAEDGDQCALDSQTLVGRVPQSAEGFGAQGFGRQGFHGPIVCRRPIRKHGHPYTEAGQQDRVTNRPTS